MPLATVFKKSRVPGITAASWGRLAQAFESAEDEPTVMAHELSALGFISLDLARALLMALAEDAAVDLYLAVFYRDEEGWRDLRPFSAGPPSLPMTLRDLDEPITSAGELSYEVVGVLRKAVDFA